MLGMVVTDAAWGLTLLVFSIKSDVTNDKILKMKNPRGPHKKFQGAYREISRVPVGHHAPDRAFVNLLFAASILLLPYCSRSAALNYCFTLAICNNDIDVECAENGDIYQLISTKASISSGFPEIQLILKLSVNGLQILQLHCFCFQSVISFQSTKY